MSGASRRAEATANGTRLVKLFLLMSRWRVALVCGLTLTGALIPALQVSTTAAVIQAVTNAVTGTNGGNSAAGEIIPLGILLAALMIGAYAIAVAVQYLSTVLRLQLTLRINELVMEKSGRMDLQQFEQSETYDVLQRASVEAGPRIYDMYSQALDLVRDLVTLVSVSAVLFQWNPAVALLIVLSPLPSIIANVVYGRRQYAIEFGRAADRRRLFYLRYLVTHESPVKEVRLFGLAPLVIERYSALFAAFFSQDRKLARFQLIAAGGLGVLSVGVASSAMVLALATTTSAAKLGQLAAYLQAITIVQSSATGLLMGVAQIYQGLLYLGNLFQFFDLPEGVVPTGSKKLQDATVERIEFRDVSFTYPGTERRVLDSVSFSLERGQCIALVGENGAGKTTIVKLLTGLYAPTSGQILLNEIPLSDYDPDDLRSNLSVIFQDFVKYEMSVRENVGFGNLERMTDDGQIEEALGRSGMHDTVAEMSHGLDTMLGRHFSDGRQLSIGQWQKVALARAFLRNASLLILDEPTASIDARAEEELFRTLRDAASITTTLLVAHRFSTVRIADRIVVLEQGRVREQGSHEELMNAHGLYAELFRMQAAGYGPTRL